MPTSLNFSVSRNLTYMTKDNIEPGLSCERPHPGELRDPVLQEAPVNAGSQIFRYYETAMVSALSDIEP